MPKNVEETPLEYVTRVFPMEKGEDFVKYCDVGNNNFRINFYTKKDKHKLMSDYSIDRSFFVYMKKDGNSWKHAIG
jgi:hypothetical protein